MCFWSFVYHWGNIYSGPLYIKNLGLAPTSSRLWTPPPALAVPPFFSPQQSSSCPGAVTGKPKKRMASCGRGAVGALSGRRGAVSPAKQTFSPHPHGGVPTPRCAEAEGQTYYTLNELFVFQIVRC